MVDARLIEQALRNEQAFYEAQKVVREQITRISERCPELKNEQYTLPREFYPDAAQVFERFEGLDSEIVLRLIPNSTMTYTGSLMPCHRDTESVVFRNPLTGASETWGSITAADYVKHRIPGTRASWFYTSTPLTKTIEVTVFTQGSLYLRQETHIEAYAAFDTIIGESKGVETNIARGRADRQNTTTGFSVLVHAHPIIEQELFDQKVDESVLEKIIATPRIATTYTR